MQQRISMSNTNSWPMKIMFRTKITVTKKTNHRICHNNSLPLDTFQYITNTCTRGDPQYNVFYSKTFEKFSYELSGTKIIKYGYLTTPILCQMYLIMYIQRIFLCIIDIKYKYWTIEYLTGDKHLFLVWVCSWFLTKFPILKVTFSW